VAFSAGGGTIAYFSPATGFLANNRVAWFGRDGKLLSYVGEPGSYRDPRISPDGRLLAIAQGDRNGLSRIWSYEIDRNAGVPILPPSSVEPVWSPNGNEMLTFGGSSTMTRYVLDRGPGVEVYGANSVSLIPFDWSPDGATILTRSTVDSSLQAIDAANPSTTRMAILGNIRAPTFSPDGHWIAYDDGAGATRRVYVSPFPGPGPRIAVSPGNGLNPRWRRTDGRELFFFNQGQMYAVDVTRDGTTIRFGAPQALFKQDILQGNFLFDVTPDGQRFVAVISGGLDRAPVTVLRNWTSAAK